MAGLRPWNAPSPISPNHHHGVIDYGRRRAPGDTRRRRVNGAPSREAVRVRRSVAALQAYLMRAIAVGPLQEELPIQLDTPTGLRVDLDHPALHALRVELLIDRPVERV